MAFAGRDFSTSVGLMEVELMTPTDRPQYSPHTSKSNHYRSQHLEHKDDDHEEIHFLVINIGEGLGFTPIWGTDHALYHISGDIKELTSGFKDLVRPTADVYVQIRIGDDPRQILQSHVVYESEDGIPRWAQFGRFYINPHQLPQTITIEAFDKSDEPEMKDARYGEYVLDTTKHGIFEEPGKIWRERCKLGRS